MFLIRFLRLVAPVSKFPENLCTPASLCVTMQICLVHCFGFPQQLFKSVNTQKPSEHSEKLDSSKSQ